MNPFFPRWVAPSWWTSFVHFVNDLLLTFIYEARQLGRYGLLYGAGLLWIVAMWIWVRDYPLAIRILYWLVLIAYVGFMLVYLGTR